MVRNPFIIIALLFLTSLICLTGESEPLPKPSQWIPQDAILTFELSNPQALFDVILGAKVEKAITSVPEFQALTNENGFKEFLGVVHYLETALATDWKAAVKSLLGEGAVFSVLPEDQLVFTADSTNPDLLTQLHDILFGFAKNDAEQHGDSDRVKLKEYNGVTGYSFGNDEVHCIIGNRFVLSNKSNILKRIIDNRTNVEYESLSNLNHYKNAQMDIDPEAALTAFLRMDILNQVSGINNALTRNLNPMAALLAAGITDSLSASNWLLAELCIDEENLLLSTEIDGKLDMSGPMAFIGTNDRVGAALPMIEVPNQIASFSFFRDLYKFYSAKDDLFPERTSGLIFFENMMGIFFTGRDLTEEVWKEIKPEIRFVAAEQKFDSSTGIPAVQLPSFAVVFKLFHPETFGIVAEEAWQKAIGLINFTRGQNALPGLLIDRPVYKDVKMTLTYFPSVGEEDKSKQDIRFNFRPTLARVKDNLILSSTDQLAEDIIDSVLLEEKNPPEKISNVHSLVQLDVDRLASILESNRETIVRNDMVEKGKTKEQAEAEQVMLTRIMQYFNQVSLQVGAQDDTPQAELKLSLNLPAAE